jgi:hypothetical protein
LAIGGCGFGFGGLRNWGYFGARPYIHMEFQTKLVNPRKNKGARLSEAGGALMFCTLISMRMLHRIPVSAFLALAVLGLGGGLALLHIGRRMTRGDMLHHDVSDTDLVVSSERIVVGDQVYPISEMQNLDFWVEGYYGMTGPSFRPTRRNRLDGMENKLHFKVNGERHLYQFLLEDLLSMQQLGQVFRQLYANQTAFAERNRGGQTFLFQQIRSKRELEEMKRKEGYA